MKIALTPHYRYTLSLGFGGELYELLPGLCEQPAENRVVLALGRPLLPNNPIVYATAGTRFPELIVRRYTLDNSLLATVVYKDVRIESVLHHPDFAIDFTFRQGLVNG